MISSPHLATTLIYNVLRRWSLYLNRCVAVLVSKALDVPGTSTPFSLELILVDLEGGHYVDLILPGQLAYLLTVRRPVRGSGNGGGGRGGSNGDVRSSGGGGTEFKKRLAPLGGTRGCGCATARTCPPCPFRAGITRGP